MDVNISLKGIHVFKGSYSFQKEAFETAKKMKMLIPIVEKKLGYKLEMVNLGGGICEKWYQMDFDFDAYREELKTFPSHICINHESGRAIFSSAGSFVTTIIHTKKLNNEIVAICDGGMAQNFLLCQTEKTFKNYKKPMVWTHSLQKKTRLKKSQTVVLAGSSCSHNDIISKFETNKQDDIKQGSICIFNFCGAYNYSYSLGGFLKLQKAKEFILP